MSEQQNEGEVCVSSPQELSRAGSSEGLLQGGHPLPGDGLGANVQLAAVEQQAAPIGMEALSLAADSAEPKRQICFDFTKNQCTRGAACKFSHDVGLIITVNSQEKGICFDFLKGLCTRGLLCRFSHDLRNLQTPQCTASTAKKRFAPICYDFVKNQCTRGEDCKYSHDYSSILYGPRAPGKDPYVICVDFTRGKCARGNACRYSHVDPRMLSNPPMAAPGGGMHPALLAAGLGAAAAAAAVAQSNQLAMPGALHDALAGLNLGAPSRQSSDLQAQAALLLSGLAGNGLLGGSLPGTPVAGGIPAAWNGMPALQQSPEGLAALLEQLQRTALTDSLAQLSPSAADAASLSALNAALLAGGSLSPTYAAGLGQAGGNGLAELQVSAQQLVAAGYGLHTPPQGLVGLMDPHQGALQQQQQQDVFRQQQQGGGHASGKPAAMLQSRLSGASQFSGPSAGSGPASATPTPTAGHMAPTYFQQARSLSPAEAAVEAAPAMGPPSSAPQQPLPPKSQPLMPVYHPMLQQKPLSMGPAGYRADILVDARSTGSPTIGASWGGQAAGGMPPAPQQSALAMQLKQQQAAASAAVGLPPPPPPVNVPASRLAALAAAEQQQQRVETPVEMASSFDQMQMIWGQRTIWGQQQ